MSILAVIRFDDEQVSRWMDKVDCEGSGRLTLEQFSDGLARNDTSFLTVFTILLITVILAIFL